MAEVPAGKGEVLLDIKAMPADFYKIVLEGKYNMVNRWWVKALEK